MTIGSHAASLKFDQVTKAFGEVTAVDRVSFVIKAGKLVTLLGPSGCGKTTTLRLIAGLEMATAGRIQLDDKDVTKLPATDRDVSMVFQSYALFPHMRVLENVAYGLTVSGVAKDEVRDRALDGLALVGLRDYGDRMPSELSGGQQQRVAVARALVLEPQVLLLDEPLSNLDAKLRRHVREKIRDIQTSLGLTAVYVTHDQEEALAVSDSIIVMNEAVIAQEGTPRDLYERPADLFVANFIGDANLIEGEIIGIDEQDNATVRLGARDFIVPNGKLAAGPVHVAVRPEALQLSPAEGDTGLDGTIRKAAYLGSHMEYTVDSPVGELFVIDPRIHTLIEIGMSVSIAIAPNRVALLRD